MGVTDYSRGIEVIVKCQKRKIKCKTTGGGGVGEGSWWMCLKN